jgi:HKD family nuclease
MSTDVELYRVNNSIRGPGDSLYKYLRASIAAAIRIRFLVAFITESGARLVAKPLREAAERGAPVTILTGTYSCWRKNLGVKKERVGSVRFVISDLFT